MRAVNLESSRTEERMRSYARTVRRAFLVTAGIHIVAALAVNPSLLLHLFLPKTMLGYPGASRPGDLGPEGTPGRPAGPTFRARRSGSRFSPLQLDVYGAEPGPSPARAAGKAATAGEFEPVSRSPERNTGTGGSAEGVHIELDENWAVASGSAGVARSEQFQTLKIVRPDYPRAAIRAGIEGLVRLEVQVDTTGKVVGVRTDMNTSSNRELEDAAIHAMLLWVFKPYYEKSEPVPFTLIVPFRYRLVD